jgi:hypothetical protein
MSILHDQWNYTDADGRRRYWRANAVVLVDTVIFAECRWETTKPQASGVGSDAWDAMAQADAVDGSVWKCPHCDDPDPDGELHMYCSEWATLAATPQGTLADAVRDLEGDSERMRQTLRGILVFVPPADMTRDDIIAAYREHARRCLDGEDDDPYDVED